jgi:predicted RNA-binding Zn ribbon-like protein
MLHGSRGYRDVVSSGSGILAPDRTSHAMGSRLCLAAVNSVAWRRSADPVDSWQGYQDVVDWVAAAGWLPQAERIRRLARQDRATADRTFRRAVALREALHELFSAVAAGEDAPPAPLRRVQRWTTRGLTALRLVEDPATTSRGYALHWTTPTLDLPVQQVAVSATLLLASPELSQLKQCPGPRCGWVFLDESRNQTRRWCDPTLCGNRNRVHAHYLRTRDA